MKNKIIYLLFIVVCGQGFSQIPTGYYDSTVGKTGYVLKTALSKIITSGHINKSYSQLWTAYNTTDRDNYYDNDNTILDMYSEFPAGVDNYSYTYSSDQCGSYSGEGSCYNREHLLPQSVFSSNSPMRTDVHHVVPSDGSVNGKRSNYPFGEVSSPTWTSQNGSKLGYNSTPGYNSTVFEPIDEFKGDIARCMLYFATRYESQISGWSWSGFDGSSNQVYTTWFKNILVSWHLQDTVNAREIARNNAAYNYQGNRNPFIDHPEWVTQIWGNPPVSLSENQLTDISVYPNPTMTSSVTISNEFPIESVEVFSVLGSQIISHTSSDFGSKKVMLTELPKGILLIKIKSGDNSVVKKLVVQ